MFAGVLGWQRIHISPILNQPSSFSYFASTSIFDIVYPNVLVTIPYSTKCSSFTCSDVADDIVPICFIAVANALMPLMVKLPLKKDSTGCT
jgi:hypothetical protein